MTLFEQCTKRSESSHALDRDTLSHCHATGDGESEILPSPPFLLSFLLCGGIHMREKKRKSAADYYCYDHRSGGGGGDTGNGYDEREARIFIAVRTTRFAIFCGGRRENTKI